MPAGMPGCGLQSVAPDAAGAWLRSVPGRRPAQLRNLHERMPVILERSAWATRLGEGAWTTEPKRFTLNPFHQVLGPNT